MKTKHSTTLAIMVVCVIAILAIQPVLASPDQGAKPGTGPHIVRAFAATPHAAKDGLTTMVTMIGKINLTTGGVGFITSNAPLNVWKTPGTTVLAAYMTSASTGFSNYAEKPGDVLIDGNPVTWDTSLANNIDSNNYWANVTSLVKTKFDSAPAGTVSFDITEGAATYSIDGEALYIIVNDPAQTADNTVIIEFGALDTTGDTFNIGLANPINKSLPDFGIQLGLTDTFSYQLSSAQFSIINVSTSSLPQQRMTTWAGGEDNQYLNAESNGALFTVGGYNDSGINPADPYLSPVGDFRYDQELYNLAPFVANGDTSIKFFTLNPSNDDNIMAATLYLKSTAAVVGEGVILTPATASNPVNTTHTLTAKAQDTNGNPLSGITITFTIISGPNAGLTGTAVTNPSGIATFSYSSSTTGTDTIVASFIDPTNSATITSNTATKIWTSKTTIPEFPTILVPAGMLVGALFVVFSLRMKKN